jgi:thiamine biosynthesis lipoprotein
MGMEHALVDLGGDLAVVGPLPDGSPWTIHVRHPLRRGDALLAVDVSRGGIATSGDYERCIEFEGRRYSHILNPTNGFPVQAMASTTVVAASCRLAGALSTTAMLMEDRAPAWLAGTDRLHAWVATDGRVGGTLFDGHSGQQAEL